jgi:hypothetical protein
MNAEGFDIPALLRMAHSTVSNYVIPGLSSSLIGMPSPAGTIRLFQCERDHQEVITPHSHRFDFQCWVLRGKVRNRIWKSTYQGDPQGDLFQNTRLVYGGDMGAYEKGEATVGSWIYEDQEFAAGQCYSMRAHEIHSIFFSRGAIVLFMEGATKVDHSMILEPWVAGKAIPTFKVEPWMFEKAPA